MIGEFMSPGNSPHSNTAEPSDYQAPVGIVTVSYGSESVLDPFLASVATASRRCVSVVVVDNSPERGDAVRQLAERFGARYLAMAENRGYGDGMNAGIAALPTEVQWVVVSNPDVAFTAGAIDRLLATGADNDRIAAVGPAILSPDGEVYPSARHVPSLRSGVGHALFANIWPGNPWTERYRRSAEVTRRRDSGWLSGACLLIRRSAFDAVRGFDPGFFMYFEDVDLGYRLGKQGWRNVYEPAAVVKHSGAHSTRESSDAMIAAHHTSAYRFLATKYHQWYLWPVRVVLRTALAIRSRFQRRHAR